MPRVPLADQIKTMAVYEPVAVQPAQSLGFVHPPSTLNVIDRSRCGDITLGPLRSRPPIKLSMPLAISQPEGKHTGPRGFQFDPLASLVVRQSYPSMQPLKATNLNVVSTPKASRALVTPVKRSRAPTGISSTTKRRNVSLMLDEPVELGYNGGTVAPEQVLRMVDASLVDTPEHGATPRVRTAALGPSPKPDVSFYAYDLHGRPK